LINRPNRGAPIGPNHTVPSWTGPSFEPVPGNKLPGYDHLVPPEQRHITPVHEFDYASQRIGCVKVEENLLELNRIALSDGKSLGQARSEQDMIPIQLVPY
jgi:hypothetical protein